MTVLCDRGFADKKWLGFGQSDLSPAGSLQRVSVARYFPSIRGFPGAIAGVLSIRSKSNSRSSDFRRHEHAQKKLNQESSLDGSLQKKIFKLPYCSL